MKNTISQNCIGYQSSNPSVRLWLVITPTGPCFHGAAGPDLEICFSRLCGILDAQGRAHGAQVGRPQTGGRFSRMRQHKNSRNLVLDEIRRLRTASVSGVYLLPLRCQQEQTIYLDVQKQQQKTILITQSSTRRCI